MATIIKTKTPKFGQYWTVRSELDERRLIKKAAQVWDGIWKGGSGMSDELNPKQREAAEFKDGIAAVIAVPGTNGLVAKSDVSASYRHVSTKILSEFPQVLDKVSYELGAQRSQFKLSMESPVDNPEATLASFNRQFGLNVLEKDAVEWAIPQEIGDTMFHVINTYTRAAAKEGLPAESSFRLSRVGGNILGMLN